MATIKYPWWWPTNKGDQTETETPTEDTKPEWWPTSENGSETFPWWWPKNEQGDYIPYNVLNKSDEEMTEEELKTKRAAEMFNEHYVKSKQYEEELKSQCKVIWDKEQGLLVEREPELEGNFEIVPDLEYVCAQCGTKSPVWKDGDVFQVQYCECCEHPLPPAWARKKFVLGKNKHKTGDTL